MENSPPPPAEHEHHSHVSKEQDQWRFWLGTLACLSLVALTVAVAGLYWWT